MGERLGGVPRDLEMEAVAVDGDQKRAGPRSAEAGIGRGSMRPIEEVAWRECDGTRLETYTVCST